MRRWFKSVAIGAVSGGVTYFLSLHALGYTNAFVKPPSFPLSLWLALVVLGVGCSLVALPTHLVAIRLLGAQVLPALSAFFVTALALLALDGHLPHGTGALAAWAAGAALASVAHHGMRPGRSVDPRRNE